MFKNDWILASLNNPTYDIDDLTSIGELSTSNTLLLSKDKYLKSNFIQLNEAFKDLYGNFSREKFDSFYDLLTAKWRDFLNNEFPTGIELDAFDTASNKVGARVKDINFSMGPTNNPDRVLIGVEGWRTTSKRTKSESEIAQSLKIFNPETGEFEKETPEDYALFSSPLKWAQSLFEDPLVFALYELDEVDSEGTKHKKGENKLNQYGTYYYEKLNGRSPLGKQVLSAADILTKEESALNKVDFFDSDDLKKSTAGVIAKNLALIAPMFTPAAPWYYKAIIAKELAKTLPMLHSIGTNLFSSVDNEAPKWMTDLAAKGEQLSTSNSTWSKEHTFSFENMANLISDVALQWGQQKQIAEAVTYFWDKSALDRAKDLAFKLYKSKIGGSLKGMEAPSEELWENSILGQLAIKKYYDPVLETVKKRQKLGGDLALTYMALISNTDVYSDMLDRGATKQEAAWVALGSTSAMFSVDKFLHIGEVFYDDLTAESIKLGRKAVKTELKEAFDKIYKKGTKESPAKWFLKGAAFGKKAAETFVENVKDHNLGGVGKALGEGLEEVSEELVTDLTKATYSLLGDLGIYDPSVKDTGAFENMLERYSMSLIGGAIGGGLYYGVEKYKGFNKTRDRDLVDLINDGKASELRSMIEGYVSKGKAGNTKISGVEGGYTTDSEGNITWLSTDNEQESQNRQVANKVLEKINSIEATIVGSGTKLSKDLLFDKMVLLEARYLEFKNASHVTGYYEEFGKRQNLVLDTKTLYAQAALTKEGTIKGTVSKESLTADELNTKNINLLQLQVAVDNAQKSVTDFLSGDSSLDYTRKLNFAIDPVLNHFFLGLNRHLWLEDKVDITKEIPLQELINLNKQWNEHVRDTMLKDLDKAFLAYKALETVVSPLLIAQLEYSKEYKQIHDLLGNLYEGKFSLATFLQKKPFYDMNSRLVDDNGIEESDEDYEIKDNKTTPDEIEKYYLRAKRIFDLNTQVLALYIQQYDDILRPTNYSIDAASNRKIILNVGHRLKDIINHEATYPFIQLGSLFEVGPYKDILGNLLADLSNVESIKELVKNRYYSNIAGLVTTINEVLKERIPNFNVMSNITEVFAGKRIDNIIKTLTTLTNDPKVDVATKTSTTELISKISNLKTQIDSLSKLDGAEELVQTLENELYSIIPIELKKNPKAISVVTFMEQLGKVNLATLADPVVADNFLLHDVTSSDTTLLIEHTLTIQDVVNELRNPDSLLFKYASSRYSGVVPVLAQVLNDASVTFGKDTLFGVLTGVKVDETPSPTMTKLLLTLDNYVNDLVKRILVNPIYSFYNKLKVNSHSPLETILSSITKEMSTDLNEIFNMNYILNLVYKDYVTADKPEGFMLNDALAQLLLNADKSLDLLLGYLYAASTTPDGLTYFGLNKQINEFAKAHKSDLTTEWEPLPEISLDYSTLLQLEVDRLSNEIFLWQRISENNSMNKIGRLTRTEGAVNKLRYAVGKGMSLKFTIDDKEYDLSEGISSLPNFNEDDAENLLNQLFNFEQTLHNNFNKILKDTKLTSELFFKTTNFWKKYLGNSSGLLKLESSKLTENIEELTKYDQALYLLSVLSDSPSDYYNSVINSIKDNDAIAPLTVLLNISRLGEAAHSKIYKAGFKALAETINPGRTVVPNTVHINGVAGSGKTEVVLKNIRQRFYDLAALIVGPTSSQAIKLLNILNESTSYTLDGDSNIFKLLLPDWDIILEQFEKASKTINELIAKNAQTIKVDTEYFSINYNLDNTGSGVYNILLLPNKIKFNKNFTLPLMFVDEAAHMNTLQIALLDAYADKVGGTVFLASDSNQSGYSKNGIENLDTTSIFATRTAKLLESLRSNNILKQTNNNKVSTLLDTIEDIWNFGSYELKAEVLKKLPNIISKLNLRVYNLKDDINGDLLGANLEEVIAKLPKEASIGFIGDADSPAYQRLKSHGFTNLGEPLTETIVPGKKFMLGLEFDYVIIDKMPNAPTELIEDRYSNVTFLKRFYTLMSRGKNASIFLDNTLPDLVGKNVDDAIKSLGFNLKGLVQNFRDSYLKLLDKILLLESTILEEPPKLPEVIQEGDELIITPLIEETPEFNYEVTEEVILQKLKEIKDTVYGELKELIEPTLDMDVSDVSDLLIEANTVVPITGLTETLTNPDGTSRRYPMWLPGKKTPVRRNINAFYSEDAPITKLADKLRLQNTLSNVLSAIIFGGDLTDSALTSLIGFGKAWKNRTLLLEVRKATESDNFGIGTDLKPNYIDVDGVAYIVAITCKLEGLSKNIADTPYSAIFDICLLSDFNKLRDPERLQGIKNNLEAKINAGKITGPAVERVRKFKDNLNESVKKYEGFIRSIVSKNPDGYSMDLDTDMYISHKTSRIIRRKTPRRLGGTLSIATVENNIVDQDGNYVEDYNNFLDTDKRKVVSPVYIVGNKSDVLKGAIAESIFGKAVVFASSNTNLSPEELPDRYIEQKRSPDTHTPEVRMMVLNNHGISFSELITHRILKQLTGEGEKSKKPWRMDTLGVRMFTAMWNFRAGLENFITLLNKWKADNKYDSAKVLDITKVESELFNKFGKEWEKSIDSDFANDLYKSYKVNAVDLKNLVKFNLEDCKDIPNFRLGIDYTSTNIGSYVRLFDVSNSSVYGKRLANLLAIEEEYATKYHSLLSTILELLTLNEPSELFKRVGFDFKPMATKLVKPDGLDFKTNEYIGKSEQERNLSGLIHTNNKNIIIGETDNDGKIISKAEITADSLFSFFPKAISAIATKSRVYQTHPNASGLISISTIDTKDVLGNFDFEIANLFTENLLKRLGNDNTLFNMFNLIFHGTIQSLESDHAYTEDAPFKYGIFVDPDLESSNDYKQINVRGLNGKDYAFLRCGTNPIYFDIDADMIPGGMALNLSKIIEAKAAKIKKLAKVETPIELNVDYSAQLIDELLKVAFLNYVLNNGISDTEEEYTKFITVLNNKALMNFFSNGTPVENILELINIKGETKFKDVRYENGKIKYTDMNNSEGELTLDTEDMYINVIPNKSNSFEDITGQAFNSMVFDGSGIDIMTHQDFLNSLEELFVDDLLILKLANSTNVENYLNLLVTMKEALSNKIDLLEDSDLKWQLYDYLSFVDTTCF